MIWTYRDGRHECDLGRTGWAEVVPDGERWIALLSNYGVETIIATCNSALAAKLAVIDHLRHVVTELQNVIAQVEQLADEE